jgi:hypothetical protein
VILSSNSSTAKKKSFLKNEGQEVKNRSYPMVGTSGSGGGHKERVKEGLFLWKYFVFMYANETMKPVENVSRRGEGNERE